jgi:hypothetical protein
MKGGGDYQDWGADGQGLCGEMRCFGAVTNGPGHTSMLQRSAMGLRYGSGWCGLP